MQPGDLVVDLGAGRGALTAPLVEAGARVIAVELHPGRAEHLKRRFRGAAVTVLHIDIAGMTLPRRPFRISQTRPSH